MKKFFVLSFLIILISIGAVSAGENLTDSGDLSASDDALYVDGGALEDGDGSIDKPFNNFKSALDKSQDNCTIYIAPGVYSGNLNTNLTVSKAINLVNSGKDDVIFDGLNKSNIFTVNSKTFNVDNLIFRNSYADNGGALYFTNGLSDSKINAAFLNNHAKENGGAIFIDGECRNNIFNGCFSANEAYSGGAIYFNESVFNTRFNANFTRNAATYRGGGIYFNKNSLNNSFSGDFVGNYVNISTGGAIYFTNISRNDNFNGDFNNNFVNYYGTLMFDHSVYNATFSGNFIGNKANNDGAAVAVSWYVENCTFSGNFSNNYVKQFNGAAVYVMGDSRNNLFNGYFANNVAPEGSALSFSRSINDKITGTFLNNSGKSFSAVVLFCENVDKLYVNGTFINNHIDRSGGVITFYRNFANNITNCVIAGDFINNTADVFGGAIYFYASLSENNTISANFYNNTSPKGAAIYFRCYNFTNTTFINSSFISNKAFSSLINYTVDNDNLMVYASLKGYHNYVNAIYSVKKVPLHFVNVTYLNADGIVNSGDVVLNPSDLEAGQNLTLEIYKDGKCVLNITNTTNNDGYASFDYSALGPGNYTSLLYHRDNDYYTESLNDLNLTVPVKPSAFLVLDKDVSAKSVSIGDYIKWKISVVNTGDGVAKNVKVYEKLPDGVKYISHSTAKGDFNPETGIWNIGDLDIDDGKVFLYILTKAVTHGKKINKVYLTTDSVNSNQNESYREVKINVLDNDNNRTNKNKSNNGADTYEDGPNNKKVGALAKYQTSNPLALIFISLFVLLIMSFKTKKHN